MVSRREFLKKTTLAAAGSAVFMGFPKLANASRTCSVLMSTSVLRGWVHSQNGKQGKYLQCISGGGLRLGSLTKAQQMRDHVQSIMDSYTNTCTNNGVAAPLTSCSLVQQDGGVTDSTLIPQLRLAYALPVIPLISPTGTYQNMAACNPGNLIQTVFREPYQGSGDMNFFRYNPGVAGPNNTYTSDVDLMPWISLGIFGLFWGALGSFNATMSGIAKSIVYVANNGIATNPNTWDYGMDYGSSQNQTFDYAPTAIEMGSTSPMEITMQYPDTVVNQVAPNWTAYTTDPGMEISGMGAGSGCSGFNTSDYY